MFVSPQFTWNSIKIAANYSEGGLVIVKVVEEVVGVKVRTIYNTGILVRSAIKFLDRNFLFIEKVQVFLDLILSGALARDRI